MGEVAEGVIALLPLIGERRRCGSLVRGRGFLESSAILVGVLVSPRSGVHALGCSVYKLGTATFASHVVGLYSDRGVLFRGKVMGVELILSALIAGAIAGVSATATEAVKDAYAAFKSFLESKIGKGELQPVEQAPKVPENQQRLKERLISAGVANNEVVLAQARQLLDVVKRDAPAALREAAIDIDRLTAGTLRVSNSDSVRGQDWQVEGDAVFDGVGKKNG
ncbi:hypothetical protein [Mesorhizobium sp.]|uniref:hypothetical protein n=1 Tax=Mesorhizobium sp. TaxID=1871066 RepID=UPI000FE531A8|nr:hypothetical protein [Mesorhizobium sp.]RWB69722.1 MAG: hypothetical protein EOQ49_19800 [Mesorhizobium sp.]